MGSQSKMIRRYPSKGRQPDTARRQRSSWDKAPRFLDLSRCRKRRKRR